MPTLDIDGVELNYVERGTGAQTVVFSHSYLVDHRQFEAQMAALEESYRVIAYDHRDCGLSSTSATPYDLDDLVRDAVGVIEATGAAPCHFVGLSTGGFVGLRIALHHRELLASLVLMDTSAEAESLVHRLQYNAMFLTLRALGTRPLLGSAMRLMFGRSSLMDPSQAGVLSLWRERIAANDPGALVRFGRAISARDDVLQELRDVDVPTLVMVGEEDRALPPPLAAHMADAIPAARLEVIREAGHLITIEKPHAVNAVLVPFIEGAS
jgi:pimeloyl-ACP methyl ester carboxylesterase